MQLTVSGISTNVPVRDPSVPIVYIPGTYTVTDRQALTVKIVEGQSPEFKEFAEQAAVSVDSVLASQSIAKPGTPIQFHLSAEVNAPQAANITLTGSTLFGDGQTSSQMATFTAPIGISNRTFASSHAYTAPGDYSVSASLLGLSGTNSLAATGGGPTIHVIDNTAAARRAEVASNINLAFETASMALDIKKLFVKM